MVSKKGFGFSIGLNISDFEKNCKNLNSLIDKTLGANVIKISNMATQALMGVSAAISAVGVAAYKFGSQMDAMKTSFESTWGSAKKAADQYDRFRHLVESSKYDMNTFQQMDKTMKALGYDMDNSAKAIQRFVNAGTANPTANIQSLAERLLQIKVTGTVSARALKDFANIGIEVSDVVGMDATKAIDTLMERMNKFNGFMDSEARDIWTQIPRTIEIVQDALAELGNYINDNFREYVTRAVNVVDMLRNKFKQFLKNENGIKEVVNAFKAFGLALTTVAVPALTKMAISLAPVALKVMAVTAAVLALTEVMNDLFSGTSQIKQVIGDFFAWLSFKAEKFIAELKKSVYEFAMNLADTLGADATAVKYMSAMQREATNIKRATQAGNEAWNQLSNTASNFVQKFSDNSITSKAVKNISELLNPISDAFNGKTVGTDTSGGSLVRSKTDILGGKSGSSAPSTTASSSNGSIWELGKTLYTNAVYYAKATKEVIEEEVTSIATAVEEAQANLIQSWKNNYDSWFNGIREQMGEGISSAFYTALTASGNFFHTLGEGFKNLGNQILATIAQMLIMTSLLRIFKIDSGTIPGIKTISSWSAGMIHDGVVSNGKIITTDPNDYLIATKDPSSLGGKANVVVNVTNNSTAEVSTDSYFDGTRTVVDLVIDGLHRNVGGLRDTIRAI